MKNIEILYVLKRYITNTVPVKSNGKTTLYNKKYSSGKSNGKTCVLVLFKLHTELITELTYLRRQFVTLFFTF